METNNKTIRDKVLNLIKNKEFSTMQITNELNIKHSSISRALCDLKKNKEIYVSNYSYPVLKSTRMVPMYRSGNYEHADESKISEKLKLLKKKEAKKEKKLENYYSTNKVFRDPFIVAFYGEYKRKEAI